MAAGRQQGLQAGMHATRSTAAASPAPGRRRRGRRVSRPPWPQGAAGARAGTPWRVVEIEGCVCLVSQVDSRQLGYTYVSRCFKLGSLCEGAWNAKCRVAGTARLL